MPGSEEVGGDKVHRIEGCIRKVQNGLLALGPDKLQVIRPAVVAEYAEGARAGGLQAGFVEIQRGDRGGAAVPDVAQQACAVRQRDKGGAVVERSRSEADDALGEGMAGIPERLQQGEEKGVQLEAVPPAAAQDDLLKKVCCGQRRHLTQLVHIQIFKRNGVQVCVYQPVERLLCARRAVFRWGGRQLRVERFSVIVRVEADAGKVRPGVGQGRGKRFIHQKVS